MRSAKASSTRERRFLGRGVARPLHPDEFAPAAEQALGPRHSPLFGALAIAISGLILSTIAWSAWAQLERVVTAVGRFEPSSRVKLINHPRGGQVAELLVRDGQKVEAGQTLALFEASASQSQLDETIGRYQFLAVQAARLEVEANGGAYRPPEDVAAARPDLVASQLRLMEARDQALQARADSLDRLIAARQGEARSAEADLARLENGAALLLQQLEAVRELAAQGLYPQLKLVDVEREYGDLTGEIAKAEARVAGARASAAEARSRKEALEREWRSEALSQLEQVAAERDRLAEQLSRRRAEVEQLALEAPTAGVIQDLQITGIGQAVAPNQPLMKLVPEEGVLVLEAKVANRDVGLLEEGQSARIKVRAFDYLRYGALEGQIARIARDSTKSPDSDELAYEVTIAPLGPADEAGQPLALSPGMLADVEIKVGSRTVLSYFTDRLRTFGDGALDES